MALWSYDDDEARELLERSAIGAKRHNDKERAARGEEPDGRFGAGAVRVLLFVLGILALAIVAGSVYGLAAGTRQRMLQRQADSAQTAEELKGRTAFTGIGTVRAKSADQGSSAVIVATIAFPYDGEDRTFAEELDRKAPVLKAAAISVLSAKKASELGPAFEGALKAALRDAFNERLSLGKVTEIWLSDFAVIQ
jgi:flagellar basal body-associated protein FliL